MLHSASKPNLERRNNAPRGTHRQGLWIALLVLVLIAIDQMVKVWIKTSMPLGEEYYITSWFRIHFIENPGMAYGITLGSKLLLTLFRLVAMSALGYYLYRTIRRGGYPLGFLACLGLVLAGGIGNVIDSVVYGAIFTESTPWQTASLVSWGEGYAPPFYGHVVDMLYFPLIEGTLPDWLPIWGGEDYLFFRPIFNLADSYISVAVFALLIFYSHSLSRLLGSSQSKAPESDQQPPQD